MLNWQLADRPWTSLETLPEEAHEIASWPMWIGSSAVVHCHKAGDFAWFSHEDIGAVRCSRDGHVIEVFSGPGQDPEQFIRTYVLHWLPYIYHYWGYQVLHSSAVHQNGAAVAFAGDSHAGKSTLAYGLSKYGRWRHLADDTLAFEVVGDEIHLMPLLNWPRIRPPARDHFASGDGAPAYLDWPADPPRLRRIYYLIQGDPDSAIAIRKLPGSEAQIKLLKQAYALTVEQEEFNKRLMRAYLTLTAEVPVFEFTYPKDIKQFGVLVDKLEAHMADLNSQ
jgi:hypothetical protein